jgi:hypothetical protein
MYGNCCKHQHSIQQSKRLALRAAGNGSPSPEGEGREGER